MIEKCPACGAPMLIFRSYNYKQCVGKNCGKRFDFFLKPEQQPLVKHQR